MSSGCCGCGKEFRNEQSLVALDKHWHLGCFRCHVCSKVLNAEYISRWVAPDYAPRGLTDIDHAPWQV